MTQDPANEDLSAYLDGELPPEASARVERALSADPALKAELEQLRLVRTMLSKHGRVDAPFGFKAKVLAAVAEEPAPASSWRSWLRRPFGIPVEGFAVALAALLVVIVVGSREQSIVGSENHNYDAPTPTGEQRVVNPERDAARAQLRATPTSGNTLPSQADEGQAAGDVTVTTTGAGERGGAATERERPNDLQISPSTVPLQEPEAVPLQEPEAVAQEPSGTADERAPALFGASYRYQVSTADPSAALQLARLAGRYGGRVTDSSGGQVSGARAGGDTGSYRVQVPAENLAEFGAALRALGTVVEQPDDRIFASSSVTIQVDLIQTAGKQ